MMMRPSTRLSAGGECYLWACKAGKGKGGVSTKKTSDSAKCAYAIQMINMAFSPTLFIAQTQVLVSEKEETTCGLEQQK